MKKSIFSAAIATLLAITLAACSSNAGAKQIVLRTATGETNVVTVGQRVNMVGDLDLSDTKVKKFEIVVEEKAPGGDWTEFRKISARQGSTSVGFALVKNEAGDYKYRATITGEGYGPFVSAEFTITYKNK
jgi:transcription elongation GreA/GreB family factor